MFRKFKNKVAPKKDNKTPGKSEEDLREQPEELGKEIKEDFKEELRKKPKEESRNESADNLMKESVRDSRQESRASSSKTHHNMDWVSGDTPLTFSDIFVETDCESGSSGAGDSQSWPPSSNVYCTQMHVFLGPLVSDVMQGCGWQPLSRNLEDWKSAHEDLQKGTMQGLAWSPALREVKMVHIRKCTRKVIQEVKKRGGAELQQNLRNQEEQTMQMVVQVLKEKIEKMFEKIKQDANNDSYHLKDRFYLTAIGVLTILLVVLMIV